MPICFLGVGCLIFRSQQILLSNSPSMHPKNLELSHFIFTIVIGVWYLCPTVVSFCISLMANDIAHLMGLFAICVSYSVKYLFSSLAHFWIVQLVLFTVESWEFYIFPRFSPLMALCLLPVCVKLMLRLTFCSVDIQLLQTIVGQSIFAQLNPFCTFVNNHLGFCINLSPNKR